MSLFASTPGYERADFVAQPPFRAGPAEAVRGFALQLVTDLNRSAHGLDQLGLGSHAAPLRRAARLVAAEFVALAVDDGPLVQSLPAPAKRHPDFVVAAE